MPGDITDNQGSFILILISVIPIVPISIPVIPVIPIPVSIISIPVISVIPIINGYRVVAMWNTLESTIWETHIWEGCTEH